MSNQFKDVFVLSEWHMYGSSRLGIQKPVSLGSHAELVSASQFSASAGTGRELVHIEFNGSWSSYEVNYADTSNTTVTYYQMSYEYYSLTRGEKNYELVNHLGNVLVVISDKKLKTCTGDTVNYYTADVVQATDYSAFGVILKGREYYADTTGKYRMGFNGKERDKEINSDGNSIDYGYRIYDSRLGRWLSTDLLEAKYPGLSPYHFSANCPIKLKDKDGQIIIDETGKVVIVTVVVDPNTKTATTTFKHEDGSEVSQEFLNGAGRVLNAMAQAEIGRKIINDMVAASHQIYLKVDDSGPKYFNNETGEISDVESPGFTLIFGSTNNIPDENDKTQLSISIITIYEKSLEENIKNVSSYSRVFNLEFGDKTVTFQNPINQEDKLVLLGALGTHEGTHSVDKDSMRVMGCSDCEKNPDNNQLMFFEQLVPNKVSTNK